MDLWAKLQLKSGQTVAVIARSTGVEAPLSDDIVRVADPDTAGAVVVFVTNEEELLGLATPAVDAARRDRLAWIAYPKGGQLSTDLNRDRLAALLAEKGVQPVRQVAIDDTWSALRFRPA
jgi:hypothetical protein